MNKSKSPIPTTKWGTACAQCAAAKAKCSRQLSDAPGSKCDRCERLLKTCTEQVQKPRKPRQARMRFVSQKESTANSHCGDTCGSLIPHSTFTSTASTTGFISHPSASSDIQTQTQRQTSRSATSSPSLSVTLSPPPLPPSSVTRTSIPPPLDNLNFPGNRPRSPSNPTTAAACDEDALSIYITQIQPFFPFILVPGNVNAQALAAERPLLMGAIRLAAATIQTATTTGTYRVPDSGFVRKQVYNFIQHVSSCVMVKGEGEGEGNLETLMAVVIVLGRWRWWCVRHGGSGRFNGLLGVAEGLVGGWEGIRGGGEGDQNGEERVTDDERRLLLGVWYLRSCAATNLSQLLPTSLSPYMNQCLHDLEMSSHQSDRVLVQLIKIQHLEQRIARLNEELLATIPKGDESGAMNRIAGLRNEWEVLNRASQSELMQNPLITSHLRTTFLRLHSPLLTHPPTPLTHLYASALGINFPSRAIGTTAMMLFQPLVDTWQSTIHAAIHSGTSSSLLTALPTPTMAMHLTYFTSLLFQLCYTLRSTTSSFPSMQDLGLAESIKHQLPLLGVGVGPELISLLSSIADSVSETCSPLPTAAASTTQGLAPTPAPVPARITSLLSIPSSLYPIVLGKWVSFATNGGVILPPLCSRGTSTSTSTSTTAASVLSSPPNPSLLPASAAGSPFMPGTDSEYEDYELDFDVDVDMEMAIPVSGSYIPASAHGQQQQHYGNGHHHQQLHGQGQHWTSTGGWPVTVSVSTPEESSTSMGAHAGMFWGQGQGQSQGHGHHHGTGGWGQGR
ncbi:hypothetical protein B0T20DRAFT_502263, partial [Sordaria brevicollis]